jgi:hypothetical protein
VGLCFFQFPEGLEESRDVIVSGGKIRLEREGTSIGGERFLWFSLSLKGAGEAEVVRGVVRTCRDCVLKQAHGSFEITCLVSEEREAMETSGMPCIQGEHMKILLLRFLQKAGLMVAHCFGQQTLNFGSFGRVLLAATGPLRIERGVITHDAKAVSVRRSIARCINSVSSCAFALQQIG